MCVEVYATYICMHVVPMWVPCSSFSLKACPKYQRQERNRPLRCSCTCKAPVSLTEALQDNTFSDGLSQIQFSTQSSFPISSDFSPQQQQQQFQPQQQQFQTQQQHRVRESWSPESSASGWSAGTRTAPQTPGMATTMPMQQQSHSQMRYGSANGMYGTDSGSGM